MRKSILSAFILTLASIPVFAQQSKEGTAVDLFVNTNVAETGYSSFNSLLNVNWRETKVDRILNLEARFSSDNGKPAVFCGVIAEQFKFSDRYTEWTDDTDLRRSGEFLFAGGTLGYNFTGSQSRVQPYVAVALGPIRLKRTYTESETGTGRVTREYDVVQWGLGGALAAGANLRLTKGLLATGTVRYVGDLQYTAGLGWRF